MAQRLGHAGANSIAPGSDQPTDNAFSTPHASFFRSFVQCSVVISNGFLMRLCRATHGNLLRHATVYGGGVANHRNRAQGLSTRSLVKEFHFTVGAPLPCDGLLAVGGRTFFCRRRSESAALILIEDLSACSAVQRLTSRSTPLLPIGNCCQTGDIPQAPALPKWHIGRHVSDKSSGQCPSCRWKWLFCKGFEHALGNLAQPLLFPTARLSGCHLRHRPS